MRKVLLQRLPLSSSIDVRTKTKVANNISRLALHVERSLTTGSRSSSSSSTSSTTDHDYRRALHRDSPSPPSQRPEIPLASPRYGTGRSMSTMTQSLGGYEHTDDAGISESISQRVVIALHNRDRLERERKSHRRTFLRNGYVENEFTSVLDPSDEIQAIINPTPISTPIPTTAAAATRDSTDGTTHIIDPALQQLRIGKKNIQRLITKLTQDYPLGSAPPQITELSIDAIDYCLQLKKQSNTGLHNAIKLICWLISERTAGNPHATFDTERTLNPLLNTGRIKSRPEDFAPVAIELLSTLQHLRDDSAIPSTMMPNLKTYNMVIDSLSKSGRRDAPTLIHSLLTTMSSQTNAHPTTPCTTPDTITHNSLLYAYSQTSPHDPNAAHTCERLLRSLHPSLTDTISYNATLHAWSRSTDKYAAPRAEALLREMQTRTNEGERDVRPNHVSFTTVIGAWGKSRDLDAAERGEGLLRLMESLGREGVAGLRPNVVTFHAVLNGWAGSLAPGVGRRAEGLLEEMIKRCGSGVEDENEVVVPGTIAFSICIKAWAHSGERGASARALALLRTMMELDGTAIHPGSRTVYRTQPDVGTINAVLRSLANDDSDPFKTVEAERLLAQMEDSGLTPDLQTYNLILRCCCTMRSEDVSVRSDAVRLATQVLLELRRGEGKRGGIGPDPYTFNFFIKVCDRLCPVDGKDDTKTKLIRAAFQFCTETGQFREPVLSILKNTLGVRDLRDVLRMEEDDRRSVQNLKIADFPLEWSQGRKDENGGGGRGKSPVAGGGVPQQRVARRRDARRLR